MQRFIGRFTVLSVAGAVMSNIKFITQSVYEHTVLNVNLIEDLIVI